MRCLCGCDVGVAGGVDRRRCDARPSCTRAAAEAGDGIAAYNVGVSEADAEASIAWLSRAADAGATGWPARAGTLRPCGTTCWPPRAATSGACSRRPGRYRDGVGTPVDLVQSVRWYLAMLNHGDGDGLREAHQIVDRMTDEQIVEAGRRADRDSDAWTLLALRHG